MKRLKLIVFGVGILFVLGAAKDLLGQSLLQKGVAQATGLQVTVGILHIPLSISPMEGKEIVLGNPPGFNGRVLARISDFFIDLNLKDLLAGKVHIQELGVVVEELFIVKNREGRLNLSGFRTALGEKNLPLRVDEMEVTLSKIVLKDETRSEPSVREIPSRIVHERFENLQGSKEILKAIFVESLARQGIPELKELEK